MRYYGVPLNMPALFLFRSQVGWLWHRALSQRSQNGRMQWDRMRRLIDRWLRGCASIIRILCTAWVSLPEARGGCGNPARPDLWRVGQGAISRTDVWYMARRRAADAGIETAIGCHIFRAAGITDYLINGGRIEVAQRMAGHSNGKTAGLYAR